MKETIRKTCESNEVFAAVMTDFLKPLIAITTHF